MSDLPHNATITPIPVKEYSHIKEPLRSRWISCITCGLVPDETVYRVRIPSQILGDKKSIALSTVACCTSCALTWICRYEPHFRTVEKLEGSQVLPTQEQTSGWIHCFRKTGFYPDSTERSGKWLVWFSPENIDRYWTKIKQAVEEGRLGNEAKVSTAKSLNKKGTHVICIYTYDYQDREDVMRVRQVLRELGVKLPIPYKANEDTSRLAYGSDYTPKYRA